MWLLAIALSAAIALTACSKNSDGPDGGEEREKGTVEVNPAKVFINGMPKAIDGYILNLRFQRSIVFIIQQRRERNCYI